MMEDQNCFLFIESQLCHFGMRPNAPPKTTSSPGVFSAFIMAAEFECREDLGDEVAQKTKKMLTGTAQKLRNADKTSMDQFV